MSDATLTLLWINWQRLKRGHRPLLHLRNGTRCQPTSCPVALSLCSKGSVLVGGKLWVDSKAEHHPLPFFVRSFIREFDAGRVWREKDDDSPWDIVPFSTPYAHLDPGTTIYVEGDPSILNGLNGVVLDDDGETVWFMTLHGNNSQMVPDGTRHIIPRDHVRLGLRGYPPLP